MFKNGFIREVEALLNQGVTQSDPSFAALGYKEVALHLKGSLSLAETISIIQTKTRQFAKRQMTWFKTFENI